MAQIHFTGEAHCPEFRPNRFKKDVCSNCQNKIQQHHGASNEDIATALEYFVDKGKFITNFQNNNV